MKKSILLLLAGIFLYGCKKSNNASPSGHVLHGNPNYYDSVIINEDGHTLLYQYKTYSYVVLTNPQSGEYTIDIKNGQQSISEAELDYGSGIYLQINGYGGPGTVVFQSYSYTGH